MSIDEAIEILSDIRAEYNIFEEEREAARYHALSCGIKAIKAEKGCPYWDAESKYCSLHRPSAQKTVGNVLESLENDAVGAEQR